MKLFRFVKKVLFLGLTILSNFTNITSLSATSFNWISMKNQECKTTPKLLILIVTIIYFILLVLY